MKAINLLQYLPRIALKYTMAMLAIASTSACAQNSWTNRYHGFNTGYDWITAVAVDGTGGVYVTGASAGPNHGGSDYLTIRYSSNGTGLWTNRFRGPTTTQEDVPSAMAVDAAGNVFIAGNSYATNGYSDFLTISYSSSGTPRWTNRYNGPLNREDAAQCLALDGAGNVFVSGYSQGLSSSLDYATIKYSNTGVPLWTNRYHGLDNGADQPSAMVVDGSGNVLVTGSANTANGPYNYETIKYSNAGVPLWTNYYGVGIGNTAYLRPYGIAIDNAGNAFVTGAGQSDYLTIKYSSAGAALWTNRFDGPQHKNDRAYAVAVDAAGNVIVTGAVDYNGSPDFATIKYSNAGLPIWTNYFHGGYGNDSPAESSSAMTVDADGNVYVTGYSQLYASYYDYLTIKYSGAGVPLWTNRYNWKQTSEDRATVVAVDTAGNVFVAGYSDGGNSTYYDYTTIKYATPIVAIPLQVKAVANQLVFTWSNPSFKLQSSSNINGEFTNIPGATSPYTNSAIAPRQFFRLIAN